ncbi:hypothetical protein LRP67_20420 [Nocardioides sp. cx-169]|nr:hypothetical protein [Nocardioides sp. cx-169]MCD4536465.1 hypothetical protein [Nocardioides sp. cx-169]
MDERRKPTAEHPLNAPEPRKKFPAALAVLALIAVVAAIFALITYLQQRT